MFQRKSCVNSKMANMWPNLHIDISLVDEETPDFIQIDIPKMVNTNRSHKSDCLNPVKTNTCTVDVPTQELAIEALKLAFKKGFYDIKIVISK